MDLKTKNKKLTDRIQKARDCKRSSARVYSSNLGRIHREFLPKTTYNQNLKWLHDNSDRLLTKLKKIDNLNTQRNLLAAAIVGLDLTNGTKKRGAYVKQIGVLNKMRGEIAAKGEMTEKQAAKFIDWKKVVKLRRLLARTVRLAQYYARKHINKSDFQLLQQNLVLHLYTLMPPVRNDWSTVRYLTEAGWSSLSENDKQTSNNLVMARGGYRIYWADYKTKKKHGVIMQMIPKQLQTLLKKHIKMLKDRYDQPYLLWTQNGTQMTRNSLTKFLQRLFYKHFRKKISTSALRSIFLTHKFDKKVLEDARVTARAMHHTPEVARDFYVKNK